MAQNYSKGAGSRDNAGGPKMRRGMGGYVGANIEYPAWQRALVDCHEGQNPVSPTSHGERVPGLDMDYGCVGNDGRQVRDFQPRQNLTLAEMVKNPGY